MDARGRISHTWRELARRHGCDANRLYHSIEHIGSLLRQLEEHDHNAVIDSDAVVLAMHFHDVVYDPLRHDNEERSAALTQVNDWLFWDSRVG
jgi:predicted metal-dependent HD superfamily phosphohydrolase